MLHRWRLCAMGLALLALLGSGGGAVGAQGPTGRFEAAAPQAPGASARTTPDEGIQWVHAASNADVDAAFARAKAEAKPVFVYWGATWCPPCNQVKATLFNRRDFIERSRAFVPVYVDGDSPGAQKLGARFQVSGYPTMVLFSPQGVEWTRLPGEVDAQRYTEVLTLGMTAQRAVKDVVAQVGNAAAPLSANDWRLLAFYSWDTDHQQVVAKAGLPALLARLAQACPADLVDVATRLRLKSWAAQDSPPQGRADPAGQAQLRALLSDPQAARAQMDVLTNSAAELTRAVSTTGSAHRVALVAAFDTALKRLEADASLSRADRIGAVMAQVDLAEVDAPRPSAGGAAPHRRPHLPAALLADIRAQAERADREITDGYERQAVITEVAYLLNAAGLGGESDALLQANLTKSHAPYYLMSELGSNAKARGDTARALHWYEQAYQHSVGPATRLQWGAGYVFELIALAPHDEARIEHTAAQVLAEAGTQPDAFYERSGRSLQKLGSTLVAWNRAGAHEAALQRLRHQLDGVCRALGAGDPKQAACSAVLQPESKQGA